MRTFEPKVRVWLVPSIMTVPKFWGPVELLSVRVAEPPSKVQEPVDLV